MAKTLADYLTLDYPIELQPDHDQGGYFARHPDLPGCTAEGVTVEEAVANLNESRGAWIEARLEGGFPVPEPVSDDFGGRISLRIPRGLHASLARAATRQGMSLNHLLTVILSEWSGGISVRDAVKSEIGSLVRAAMSSPGRMEVTTNTTTKTETRLQLLQGGADGIAPQISARASF